LSTTTNICRPAKATATLSATLDPAWGVTPKGGGHGVGHRGGVTHGGQLHQPHPVTEGAGQLGRDVEGQAGLAHPARPGQGHQPVRPDQAHQFGHLGLAAHEAGGLFGQVPR
jgi:hypothetical protein